MLDKQLISIHAPRVGCDCHSSPGFPGPDDFNPRTPCGVRHLRTQIVILNAKISIHAPRVGCDGGIADRKTAGAISIHAPRVGCDLELGRYGVRPFDFNPRTPCGVRRVLPGLGQPAIHISIHAPRVGCDA